MPHRTNCDMNTQANAPSLDLTVSIGDDRPKRADAVANRELILRTAERLFEAEGVEAVSMSQIARAAGVGKGTLYRAFPGKGDLCIALMDEDLRQFQERTFTLLGELQARPALEQLMAFLRSTVRFFDRHAPLMCEAQAHGVGLQTRPEMNATAVHGWFHVTVTLLLRRSQAEGDVRAEADSPYLADLILSPLNPTLFRYQRQVAGYSLEQMTTWYSDFVLHGIARA